MRPGLLVLLCCAPATAWAMQAPGDEPPPPVRAVAVQEAPILDGRLDDAAWEGAPPFTHFVQQVPDAGAPATERTEVRLVYDDEALYVGVRAYQSPDAPIRADELRRDAGQMHHRNDTFTVALDTFHDQRNGYVFIFSALGAMADWACTDEGRSWSQDWDTVWSVSTRIHDWGWSGEMRLPFRSLRFDGPGPQLWGITMRRIVLARNEWSYSTFIPPEWGDPGIGKFSSANELQGLRIPASSHNLEVTPYALGGVVDSRSVSADPPREVMRDVGLDVKYGLTPDLTADFTVNTDFAQVEADEQQINFTRFSLFFPEKRQFFLEGKGIFDFGATRGSYRLLPFFSRRIGLESARAVPILGGSRLTGKVGGTSVGALFIRTDDRYDVPATNFSVVRLKHDILKRSSIGFIATDRRDGTSRNHAFGADAYLAFGSHTEVEGFVTRAWSPERADDSWAYRLRAARTGDLLRFEVDRMRIGSNYDPGVGFVSRRDVDRWFGNLQVSPRPRSGPVRQYFVGVSVDQVEDGLGQLSSQELKLSGQVEFHSADIVQVAVSRRREGPALPFTVASTLTIPAGSYTFRQVEASWEMSRRRPISGRLAYRDGGYFGGSLRSLSASLLLKATRHLNSDVTYQISDVSLPDGDTVAHLLGVRLNHSASTRLFSSALLQWNGATEQLDVNVRVSWMYRPLSYLYVVYTRTSATFDRPWGVRNQSFVIKLTRLMRF